MSACLRVCLFYVVAGTDIRYIARLYVYLYTFFLLIWLLTLALLLHLSCFAFCVLNFVFRKGSFLYCLLPFAFELSAFYFCLLCLNFCIFYFGFGFSHASSMIKRHLNTDRQLIAY